MTPETNALIPVGIAALCFLLAFLYGRHRRALALRRRVAESFGQTPAEPERPQSAMPAPAPQAAEPKAEASAPTGDSDIWLALMESYKNRLTPDKRAFVGQADGRLANGVLTVYCPTAVTKAMLDTEAVAAVLREVTGQSVGQAIAVRFVVGEPEDGKKRDKFQDLLRMGSKFDNFNIK